MLSRGASGPKRLREGGKPFGKPIDPNCLRQRALFAATETKKAKQNGKLLPDACSYPASHDGQDCCKGFWCSEPGYYSQGLVRDLRIFLFRLSIADKNLFIDKRMTFDPKANNTKGAKGYTHYLENPQCLAKLLVDANISGCCSLPRPHVTEMTPVCSKWFRWAVLLQLDNSYTTKQNKGNGLFGFLAWLESAGIFRDIEVAFLPVGHTHSDIDQFFSR